MSSSDPRYHAEHSTCRKGGSTDGLMAARWPSMQQLSTLPCYHPFLAKPLHPRDEVLACLLVQWHRRRKYVGGSGSSANQLPGSQRHKRESTRLRLLRGPGSCPTFPRTATPPPCPRKCSLLPPNIPSPKQHRPFLNFDDPPSLHPPSINVNSTPAPPT